MHRLQGLLRSDQQHPYAVLPERVGGRRDDVTTTVKSFYEETPFPNYDDFDNVGWLVEKARKGVFAKLLDDQIPFGRGSSNVAAERAR